MTDPATSSSGVPTSPPLPRPPGPGTAARPTAPRPGAADEPADRALDAALARLGGLEALGVHEHVEVYVDVDRALRQRLAAAEG